MKLNKDQINAIFEVGEQVLSDILTAAKESFKEVIQEEFGEPKPCTEKPSDFWIDVQYAPAEDGEYLALVTTSNECKILTATVLFYSDGKWNHNGVVSWAHIPK